MYKDVPPVNCCNYGGQVPVVWFYGNTHRPRIRDGHGTDSNASCDPDYKSRLSNTPRSSLSCVERTRFSTIATTD